MAQIRSAKEDKTLGEEKCWLTPFLPFSKYSFSKPSELGLVLERFNPFPNNKF